VQSVVAKQVRRFVDRIPVIPEARLRAEKVQPSCETSAAPWHTVLLHDRHHGSDNPFAVVLMTTPFKASDDKALLQFVVWRARVHMVPYFVTRTLRDAIVWRTPKPGTSAARDFLEKLKDCPGLYDGQTDQGPSRRADTTQDPLPWRQNLLRFGTTAQRRNSRTGQIDATYFVNRLLGAVHHLLPLVPRSIHDWLVDNPMFRDELAAWAVEHGIAGDPADPEFAQSIARQVIYCLLGKILFYWSLRRSARQLPKRGSGSVDTAQVLHISSLDPIGQKVLNHFRQARS